MCFEQDKDKADETIEVKTEAWYYSEASYAVLFILLELQLIDAIKLHVYDLQKVIKTQTLKRCNDSF